MIMPKQYKTLKENTKQYPLEKNKLKDFLQKKNKKNKEQNRTH